MVVGMLIYIHIYDCMYGSARVGVRAGLCIRKRVHAHVCMCMHRRGDARVHKIMIQCVCMYIFKRTHVGLYVCVLCV